MTLLSDVAALLAGLGVPVLMPEENLRQLGGYTPGKAAGGLTGYLQANPGGAVQLEEPQPITSDGLTSELWLPVGCLAKTAERAEQVAQLVRARLCGDPVRDPGEFELQIPDTGRRLTEQGAYMCRPTFKIVVMVNA